MPLMSATTPKAMVKNVTSRFTGRVASRICGMSIWCEKYGHTHCAPAQRKLKPD